MSYAAHSFSLRQLQYAVAVADLLSFRRAAEACHVSQPSLSAQLAQLEEVISIQLFERDRRRVLPTVAGKAWVEQARRVLLGADDLLALAKRASDPFKGPLRVGVIPTISPYLLPSITPELWRAFPELSLLWLEDKTEVLVQQLQAGALDAAVVALEADIGDLEHALIASDPFVLAARPTDPLGQTSTAVTLAELRHTQVLLLDDGHCFREQALAYCTKAKARELEFRATSLTTLTQMVAGGAGVTLLPELAVPTEIGRSGLKVRRFAAPAPARTIALVWRKHAPTGDALQRLAAKMREAYPWPAAHSEPASNGEPAAGSKTTARSKTTANAASTAQRVLKPNPKRA
jgi:LysR family transcriptional regulator, hydrogen peroxide-inducible genes activator